MTYNIIDNIIAYENGELNDNDVIYLFKQLYLSGHIFSLQGVYQRTFNYLIENKYISLSELQALKEL